ncbi:MarR-like DNA-binding transcriptional regulator SgrR of sgrS sRNA [Paenibacillus phyllosphaerae]|uniref:MarR-like DNA-binding transcriptional regulator SgrR of sgrS sRNA n=1 Tax=Paenibacillus phyllosphaerae TaxID=274593 RepID=A0A7W5AWW4_9BACL|nr:hypothetical protein [Paenibacillus phyllosphaerae]MBB3110299.1 MarR-like DNA-binding transcriptional regulator SgrR of sgrS sRNA [Paenibacillus phyllosphaerae]
MQDPAYVSRRTEAHWVEQIFNTLVTYSAVHREVRPSLAHYWEWDATRTRWEFHLRKGVRFQHGRNMT